MKLSLHKIKEKAQYQAHIIFAHSDISTSSMPPVVKKVFKEKLFSGTKDEYLFLPYTPVLHGTHLLLVGLGRKKNLDHQSIRHAAGTTLKILEQRKIKKAAVDLSYLSFVKPDQAVKAVSEGFLICNYKFNEHKQSNKKNPVHEVNEILLLQKSSASSKLNSSVKKSLKEAEVLSKATNFARWVSDQPGNLMTPTILANNVIKLFSNKKVRVTVWNKARIKKEKMGGLLGVSLGSGQEPRFIIMEYQGTKASKKPICFVGKGLTFDSGGISIKPSARMDEMKFDMCGGAAVIGAMAAICEMNLKVNVLALVPSSENMPGQNANKPGDILKARNGKTMEVMNTDAEGRLILADGLSYACEQKPQAIFDAATLTGAMVVALGNSHTGVFSRNAKLVEKIKKASQISGEPVWPMPLTDDHVADIKTPNADVANIAMQPHGAGSATAAAFLEHFVEPTIPWAHFDIAGTAWGVSKRLSYIRGGASGVMVRTFYALATSYQSSPSS